MAQSLLSPALPSPINQLPEELLFAIFQQVHNGTRPGSFIACLLCCKHWYNVGLPLLFMAIVLRESNLEVFLTQFPSRNFGTVSFLTVSIRSFEPAEAEACCHRLGKLAMAIRKMVNLSTLSFHFRGDHVTTKTNLLPTSIVSAIVESLSMNCVNLEIDTNGFDYVAPNSAHLCDQLGHVLPRLRNLRLRLANMCPAIFAAGFNKDGTIEDLSAFTPVVASFLKTAVINCRVGRWQAQNCGARIGLDSAYIPLINSLRELVARGNYPNIERLWLVYRRHNESLLSQYPIYNRCDMIQNKTWAIPFVLAFGSDFNLAQDIWIYFMRTPEGQDVASFAWVIDRYVEGQTWKETLNGCSMPAAAIMRSDFFFRLERPLSLMNLVSWKPLDPGILYSLLRVEKETGLRLLYAVQREGLTDESPVERICPNGWKWRGDLLERRPSLSFPS